MSTKAPTPKTETSPKVWVSLAAIVGTGVLTGFLDSVTVEMFSGLGSWGFVLFSVITAAIAGTLMWLKGDPLRTYGAVLRDAHGEDGADESDIGKIVENPDGTVTVRPGQDPDRLPGPDHRA